MSDPTALASTGEAPPATRRYRRSARILVGAGSIVVPTISVLLLFLWPYLSGRVTTPIGGDTPWYIARQRAVEADGLGAITSDGPGGPRGPKTLGDRPGYPIVASLTSAATGVEAFDLAYILPAAGAVTLALAAGAFGVAAFRDPSWSFAVYAIAVGASTLASRTAVQSHDNLLADALLVAAGALALRAADGAGTRLAPVVLIAAASIVHWRFVVPFLLLMGVVGLLMLPELIQRLRSGDPLRDAPATRYWSVLAGSALAGATALAMAPSFQVELPKVRGDRVREKTREWIPSLRLPILGSVAGIGAVATWWPRDRVRRWALAMMVLWAMSVPLAIAVSDAFSRNVPVYRVAAFALGIPMLAGGALVGIVRLGGHIHPVAAAVGIVILLAGLVGGWRLAADHWWSEEAIMASDEVQQFTAAASYMNARGTEDPVVFVVERGRSTGPGRAMRAVLPVALVRRAYIYLGSTQNLLDGRETVHDDPRTARDSQRWWRSVERLLDADPIILRPAAFAVVGAGDLGEEISPGLTLVRGPTPPEAFAPAPFRQPAAQLHLIGSVGILVVWFVVGLGWAIALVPLEGLVRVGVAPALGIAMLALAGLIADRVGIRLSGVTGLTTVLVTAAAGAVGAWVLFRVRRDPPT